MHSRDVACRASLQGLGSGDIVHQLSSAVNPGRLGGCK
jgi:hypothetical protein